MKEFDLNRPDKQRVQHSIEITRKIRAATLLVAENHFPADIRKRKEQQALKHADTLVRSTARLIVGNISGTPLVPLRHELDTKLTELDTTYGKTIGYTYI